MPGKKGQRWTTPAQERQIAILKATGKTGQQVAEEMGKSVKTIERIVAKPRVKASILDLKERYSDKIEALFPTSLETLKSVQDKRRKDYAPSVALGAARASILLPMLGEPPIKAVEVRRTRRGGVLLEEILATYHTFQFPEENEGSSV